MHNPNTHVVNQSVFQNEAEELRRSLDITEKNLLNSLQNNSALNEAEVENIMALHEQEMNQYTSELVVSS